MKIVWYPKNKVCWYTNLSYGNEPYEAEYEFME